MSFCSVGTSLLGTVGAPEVSACTVHTSYILLYHNNYVKYTAYCIVDVYYMYGIVCMCVYSSMVHVTVSYLLIEW